MTNIDYKALGISEQTHEYIQIYHEFKSLQSRLCKFMDVNEKWLDVTLLYCDSDKIYDIKCKFEDIEEMMRNDVRALWNFETRLLY